MYRFLFLITLSLLFNLNISYGQRYVWNLEQCVQYALDHNISIQQNTLNKRLANYALLQSRLAQLPSINASGNYAKNFGRSIDPTTYQYVDAGFDNIALSANTNVLVFGWFQQRNTIAKNKFNLQASEADLAQLKDDVSLNIATGFLRALLAQEQVHAGEKQVELSKAQLQQTKSFAQAGRLPELNVAQGEAQLANDSATLINAIAGYNSALLDLKVLLNLDFNVSFDILTPEVQVKNELATTLLAPEEVYEQAKSHFGTIKGAQMRMESAKRGLYSAKGNLLPQLSIGAQLGTNWSNNYKLPKTVVQGVEQNTGFYTHNNDSVYVYSPLRSYYTPSLNDQLSNNNRQMVGATLTVPLFNGWQTQYGVKQASINLKNQELALYQAQLNLKQNVYRAHNDAMNAIQKYYASLRASDAAARALEFAKKRYELGLTSTIDYLITQNQNFTATFNLLSAKYDLIFKLKVIDYYMGKALKL